MIFMAELLGSTDRGMSPLDSFLCNSLRLVHGLLEHGHLMTPDVVVSNPGDNL